MLFTLWAKARYFLADYSLYIALIIISSSSFLWAAFKLSKYQTNPAKKKIALCLLTLFYTFILTFSGFEAYFRYAYDESDGLGFMKINERWNMRHVIYNNYFFRDRNFESQKREGVTRIGVLGDSITFGGGIENTANRFSNILEEKLTASGHNVEVYNLGSPGYDTKEEIKTYKEKAESLNFDIIVWEYFLNDIQLPVQSTGTKIIQANIKKGQIVKILSDKSFFFDYMYWRLSQRYNKTLGELRTADIERYHDQNQLADHKNDIATFLKEQEESNKKVVVIIFPLLYFLGPDYPAGDIHLDMKNHFEANGAITVDMLDYLKDKKGQTLWASKFDSHPNEYVHNIAAEKLFKVINPLVK